MSDVDIELRNVEETNLHQVVKDVQNDVSDDVSDEVSEVSDEGLQHARAVTLEFLKVDIAVVHLLQQLFLGAVIWILDAGLALENPPGFSAFHAKQHHLSGDQQVVQLSGVVDGLDPDAEVGDEAAVIGI